MYVTGATILSKSNLNDVQINSFVACCLPKSQRTTKKLTWSHPSPIGSTNYLVKKNNKTDEYQDQVLDD